jgi:DNA-directed RNA polymerase subunit RPC12/RpoP
MDRTSENDMNQKEYQCTHCGKIGTNISRSKILLKSKREKEKENIKTIFQQHS